jgi:hypothetical protein
MSRLAPSRVASGLTAFFAEALILLPALALGLVWAGVIFMGLFSAVEIEHHRPAIEHLMTLLLIVAVGCFTLGVLLFALARGRRGSG